MRCSSGGGMQWCLFPPYFTGGWRAFPDATWGGGGGGGWADMVTCDSAVHATSTACFVPLCVFATDPQVPGIIHGQYLRDPCSDAPDKLSDRGTNFMLSLYTNLRAGEGVRNIIWSCTLAQPLDCVLMSLGPSECSCCTDLAATSSSSVPGYHSEDVFGSEGAPSSPPADGCVYWVNPISHSQGQSPENWADSPASLMTPHPLFRCPQDCY